MKTNPTYCERFNDPSALTVYRGPCKPRIPVTEAQAAGNLVFGLFRGIPAISVSHHESYEEAREAADRLAPAPHLCGDDFIQIHALHRGWGFPESLVWTRHPRA